MKIKFGFANTMLACAALTISALACTSASADFLVTSCGAPTKSVVRTLHNDSFTTTSKTFVNVTGALVKINVPTGQTQCVKVRFFTSMSCAVTNSTSQRCFVKVLDKSNPFLFAPASAAYSHEPNHASHSFEWATRLGAGSHPIQIQALIDDGTLAMSTWTLDVEVAQ